jgi:hypothetical protein
LVTTANTLTEQMLSASAGSGHADGRTGGVEIGRRDVIQTSKVEAGIMRYERLDHLVRVIIRHVNGVASTRSEHRPVRLDGDRRRAIGRAQPRRDGAAREPGAALQQLRHRERGEPEPAAHRLAQFVQQRDRERAPFHDQLGRDLMRDGGASGSEDQYFLLRCDDEARRCMQANCRYHCPENPM